MFVLIEKSLAEESHKRNENRTLLYNKNVRTHSRYPSLDLQDGERAFESINSITESMDGAS